MSACYSEDDYEIVFMKINGRIEKEMMYSEFESILDSFLAYSEFAGQEVQCIYLVVSPQIKIKGAVFFIIGFDGAGNPDPRWNVPLRQLANEGMDGPDLGAGPIKLCCRSQTSVNWADKDLWDPDMDAKPNDFVLIRDVVKRNKLSLQE
ncbi:MAG: chromosome partitioning protein ParA, partial [Pseudomonadales bacterium]|nr:chromosome partitioning protein ParA [Pseudomonadales bacterium]